MLLQSFLWLTGSFSPFLASRSFLSCCTCDTLEEPGFSVRNCSQNTSFTLVGAFVTAPGTAACCCGIGGIASRRGLALGSEFISIPRVLAIVSAFSCYYFPAAFSFCKAVLTVARGLMRAPVYPTSELRTITCSFAAFLHHVEAQLLVLVPAQVLADPLSDEAGEVIVLEESGQQISGEFGRVPDNKTLVVLTPGDNRISGGIIHHFISLGNERRQSIDATRIFIHHNSDSRQINPN
nr:hypothetical protein CDL15_Pgr023885 [Ipomoea batatas]